MLDAKIVKKINDFVYVKPRTIQEVSHLINKNWRTADSYVNKIIEQSGNLGIRTFREGTRGALKIVFWNNIEKIHSSEFQEYLFRAIESGKSKLDFSPFDIFQYVDSKKRDAFLEKQEDETNEVEQNLTPIIRSAKNQLLIFSGNLSWAHVKQGNVAMMTVLEELAKNNVQIKIIAEVDLNSLENIKRTLAINNKLGKEVIEIRHRKQPLRAFIVDNKIARFKEIKNLDEYKKGIKKKTFIFYEIFDEEWIEWLQKVFWNLFRSGIDAKKRIRDMESIQKIK